MYKKIQGVIKLQALVRKPDDQGETEKKIKTP